MSVPRADPPDGARSSASTRTTTNGSPIHFTLRCSRLCIAVLVVAVVGDVSGYCQSSVRDVGFIDQRAL